MFEFERFEIRGVDSFDNLINLETLEPNFLSIMYKDCSERIEFDYRILLLIKSLELFKN